MSRRIRRLAATHLYLEHLEDRCLLSASPLTIVAGDYAADRILVGYADGSTATVALTSGTTVDTALASYQSKDGVAFAERDYTVSVALTPNDPSFGQLFGLHNTGQNIQGTAGTTDADIDAVEAWNTTTGSARVVVGIIDTGIDHTHIDLYKNIWINQEEIPTAVKNAIKSLSTWDVDNDGLITFWDLNDARNQGTGKITDLDGNGRIDGNDILRTTANGGWADGVDNDAFQTRGISYSYIDDLIGWDFVNNDNNPFDDNSHGTHVAGTIGAMGNNGVGVTGVNWKVSMAGLKFLSASGSGSTSGAVKAIDYAVGNGMDLTNNSWGGGGYSSTLEAAIRNARDADQLFVAAAGNESNNNDATASYPASYALANILAVAAVTNRDQVASFSNYGATTVDIAAPGVNILSTTPNGNYAYFSGTSMAAPHVAGAAALLLANNASLTYSQLAAALTGNVDTPSGVSGKVSSGRLNVNKALGTSPSDTSGARLIGASILGTQTAVQGVRVTFNEDITSDTAVAGYFTAADVTEATFTSGVTVTRVDARNFDVRFAATLTTVGSYSFLVGPNIVDLAGHQMNQNQNGTNGETGTNGDAARITFNVAPANLTFTNSTQAAIRDRATTTSTIVINQDATVADLNVKVNLTHTYDSDLRIRLTSPTGVVVTLFQYHGGSGDNLTNTVFDDEAATAISAGAAPFSGSFRPYAALSGFDNRNIRGTWTLSVYDRYSLDTGTLLSWSLIVTPSSGSAGMRAFSVSESAPVAEPAPVVETFTVPVNESGVAFALLAVPERAEVFATPTVPEVEEAEAVSDAVFTTATFTPPARPVLVTPTAVVHDLFAPEWVDELLV